MEKKDYSYLKGVEFDYHDINKNKARCFVADIDYDRGITVKGDLNDCTSELEDYICLNKKDIGKGLYILETEQEYKKFFYFMVQAIEHGKYCETSDPFNDRIVMFGEMSVCAFE